MEENGLRPGEESLLRRTALRIVKDQPGIYGMPQVAFDADFYCVGMKEEAFCYETEKEFVVYAEHLLLTDACLVTGSYEEGGGWETAAVVCEGRRLLLQRDGKKVRFTFEISGLTGKTRTLYIHTILREPGLTLRAEQNDEGRRAGAYRQGEYPAVQTAAALHYEFGMRELLKKSGVPSRLNEAGLGYLLLLGFETNNEVHGDWPPHWHLIFRWPDYCGSQAPHIYLDETGRMTRNLMCIDGIPRVRYTYAPGEWCSLVDRYGRHVLEIRIDEDGGMSAAAPNGPVFRLGAYRDGCVKLYEEAAEIGTVRVQNDTQEGVLRILKQKTGYPETTEEIRYDPLSGGILGHTGWGAFL